MTGSANNSLRLHTGVAAILAGTLIFAGHVGELVFGSPSDAFDAAYVALFAGGLVAFVVALWGLRPLVVGTRRGRVGIRLALVGVVLLAAFAVQVAISVARTGDIPDNFILFALGFLSLFVSQMLLALALRGVPGLGPAWLMPLVATLAGIFALTVPVDALHDAGLVLFEAAWVAFGVTLIRAATRDEHVARPA